MKEFEVGSVVRRWGFYINHRLAYAGVACLTRSRDLWLRFIEAEQHAHSATLPERIRFEQLIRERVGADVDPALGFIPVFSFEPYKLDEHQLASQVFGPAQTKPLPGK